MQGDRLIRAVGLPKRVRIPTYEPQSPDIGIVHIGAGRFHRAHQAVYTDDALCAAGGNWRIAGVSIKHPTTAIELNPQNGLFSVVSPSGEGEEVRVIGSIAKVLYAPKNPEAVIERIADPAVRIISLTIGEEGYRVPAATKDFRPVWPLRQPVSAMDFIALGLQRRRERDAGPLAILPCDDLSDNGPLTRAAVTAAAAPMEQGLESWIGENVTFPSSLATRFVRYDTQARDKARKALQHEDLGAVECEAFREWIIEDDFAAARPSWEVGGAQLVTDIAPYMMRRDRLDHGGILLLSLAGVLCGRRYLHEAAADDALGGLVTRHLGYAASTIDRSADLDLSAHSARLLRRFADPMPALEIEGVAKAHMPHLRAAFAEPALVGIARGEGYRSFAFGVALWLRVLLSAEGRAGYAQRLADKDIRDAILQSGGNPRAAVQATARIERLFPPQLAQSRLWIDSVTRKLETMLTSPAALSSQIGCKVTQGAVA